MRSDKAEKGKCRWKMRIAHDAAEVRHLGLTSKHSLLLAFGLRWRSEPNDNMRVFGDVK
jgi:hypothetical protein